jgi:hypothetical protein
VRCSIQTILLLCIVGGLGGCYGPDYGPTYGYPTNGFSPYSYGVPVYARGYAPTFDVHHPWEEHHGEGHHESFFRGPVEAPHVAARPVGVVHGYRAVGHAGDHH